MNEDEWLGYYCKAFLSFHNVRWLRNRGLDDLKDMVAMIRVDEESTGVGFLSYEEWKKARGYGKEVKSGPVSAD